jgi:hypothetical protein
MAKDKSYFSNFDTPYEVQPPKGAAEGPINYGGVTTISEAKDPMGVMPPNAKQHNLGPHGGEG